MVTLLVTSVGSISATGLVMCLGHRRTALRLIGTNSTPDAVGNFLVDHTYLVPPTADGSAWRRALERIVEKHRPAMILNGRDEELPILAEMAGDPRFCDSRFLVPPVHAVAIFNDKGQSARFAAEHGLPFAETASSPNEVRQLVAKHGLPLVVKPRCGGFGSRGAFLATSERTMESALNEGSYVFQEPLGRPEIEANVARWKQQKGVPWAWSIQTVDHEIDLIVDGEPLALCCAAGHADGAFNRDIRPVDEPEMRRVGEQYGRALGALGHVGPVNLQGKLLSDGRFVPFEMNARFTGTMVGKAALGFNLVDAAVAHWTGGRRPPLAANSRVALRLPLFQSFAGSQVETLRDTGEWCSDGRP